MTDKLIGFMLLFVSFPSCLLAIFITKTHNFMIIGCSPTSNYTIFSNIFFRTASEILFTDIKLYCRQGPNIQKMLLFERFFQDQKILTLQYTSVPFHKLKHNVKIVTFYHVLTPAPRGPTLKQKTGHIKSVIISNCTKFLKYTNEMLLPEIIQNTSSTTHYFF